MLKPFLLKSGTVHNVHINIIKHHFRANVLDKKTIIHINIGKFKNYSFLKDVVIDIETPRNQFSKLIV